MKLAPHVLSRVLLALLVFASLNTIRLSAYSPDTWTPGAGWNLIWSDEFTDPTLNGSNWGFDLGGGGWGNSELETYTSSNAAVQNGELVISALKDASGKYTSARLKTEGKRSWQYGKIAARIRLPYGQGIWPAFWMMGDNISTVGWPKCGETDIMEMIGGGENRDDTWYGTMHWDENNQHQSTGSGPRELPDPAFLYQDYHVFEIEWNSSVIIWRMDSTEYFRASVDTSLYPARSEFHQPFFILLNVAVGGSWPGNPDSTTVFPQQMFVDWVRVYQNGAPPPPTPPQAPANLRANANGKHKINLTWTQSSSPGITQNKIYRSASGSAGPYVLRATLGPAISFSDNTVASGQTYFYSVTAVNSNGESAYSNYASAKAR